MALRIDFLTLLVGLACNLVAISVALPLIMGRRVSHAARCTQGYMVLQALAWPAMIASNWFGGELADRLLSTVAIACGSAAQWLLFLALADWLGPRPGRRTLLVLAIATPAGYLAGFDHYAFRVGWANFLLVGMLLILARATFTARRETARGWRMLLLVCLLTMAGVTLARGWVGAFTPDYPHFLTPHPINLAFALASNLTLVLGIVALLVAWRDEAESQLRTLALTDTLTGLPNRRSFAQRAEAMLALAQRQDLSLTAVMLDLDHFKRINDSLGHEAGDRALKLFARVLMESCRSGDLAARVGGEEFCVLLPHQGNDAAAQFDLRLRTLLRAYAQAELGTELDFSAGVTHLEPGDSHIETLMARADAALYRAKAAGRGRLCT